MALLVESKVVVVDEDRDELYSVLHADLHAVRVHHSRKPSVVLDLVLFGHGDAGATLAVRLIGLLSKRRRTSTQQRR